jgi:hypothetical protein
MSTAGVVDAGKFNPIDKLFQPLKQPTQQHRELLENSTMEQQQQGIEERGTTSFIPPRDPFAPTPEEREAERLARRERNRQRQAKVQEAMKKVRPQQQQGVEKLSQQEFELLQKDHPEFRRLWGGGNSNSHMIQYADPGDDYDMWQQAYRMLGGFIDCDHHKDQRSGDHGGEDGQGNNAQSTGCSRWMMWASVSTV